MARPTKGHIYFSHGAWYVSFVLAGKKEHFRLTQCQSRAQAEERRDVLLMILNKLREAGREHLAEPFLRQAGEADANRLSSVMVLLQGLLDGTESEAPPPPAERLVRNSTGSMPNAKVTPMTVREFAELWTSNELAHRYRRRVKEIDHTENARRLKNHVLPVVFRGKTIGDTLLAEFTLDHADHVLAQPTLPEGSVRQVAQIMHRLLRLAEFPARIIERSPFPRGWLPEPNPVKARSYLFPSEDLALLRHAEIPLVKRLYIGVAHREGPRRGNLVTLTWSCLLLDFEDGSGYLTLDHTKNGRDANWALDPGTAEALRQWKKTCPSKTYVFPELALPQARRRQLQDRPMHVSHFSDELRAWLRECGVDRPKLFERNEHRIPLRAHDLRASFVTLALANGKSEAWVTMRTGHTTSAMLNRYRRDAESIAELNLGWFAPLHEAIPEFRAMGLPANDNCSDAKSAEGV